MWNIQECMHLIKLTRRKVTGKADSLVTLSASYRVLLCIRLPSSSDTTVMGGRRPSPDSIWHTCHTSGCMAGALAAAYQ